MEKLAFTSACLSYIRVIMVIMRVSLVEWLCQIAMGRVQHSSTCCQAPVSSSGHVLSHQAINDEASQDLGIGRAYLILKALEQIDWMPGPISSRGGRQNGETGGAILPAHDYRKRGKAMACITFWFSSF
jgi:hypothetical protein